MFVKLRNSKRRTRTDIVSDNKPASSGKLGYLESIRGLAALAVVFAHILAVYLPGVMLPGISGATNKLLGELFFGLPLGFLVSGHFAVVLFFVLSGFVLTFKFFKSNNQQDLHKQAAKRFLRLGIPIFVIVLIAYFMLAGGLMGNTAKVVELTGSPEAARNFNFTTNLGDAFHAATVGVIAENDVKLNPVLWTMPIEFFGSFIVFGLAAFVVKVRRRWFVYAGAILLLGDSYYTCFILGMMLADIVQNTNFIDFVKEKVNKFYYVAVAAIVWVVACFPSPSSGLDNTIYETLVTPGVDISYIYRISQFFGALLLLTLVLCSVRLQKLLNGRALVFLGGISFAVYLLHYLILYSAGHTTYVISRTMFSSGLSTVIAGVVTLTITLVAAVIWKRYIDDMSVSVSRKVANALLVSNEGIESNAKA